MKGFHARVKGARLFFGARLCHHIGGQRIAEGQLPNDHPASYPSGEERKASSPVCGHRAVERFLEAQRHRLPLFAPALLGAGIALWFAVGPAGVWRIAALSLALAAAGLWLPEGRYLRRALVVAGLLLIVGFAVISLRAASVAPDMLDRPWVGRIYARVVSVENSVALGKQRLLVETEGRQGLPAQVRLSRPIEGTGPVLFPGDVIAAKVRLLPPASAAFPGAYDFSQRAFFDGLGAAGSILGEPRLLRRADGAGRPTLRSRLADHVRANIGGDAGAIAATLASGDRSAISAGAAEDMRRSGMAHLLSISGLHVTAVVGAVFLIVLRALALSPTLALRWNLPLVAAAAGALAALGYTWLTGAAVPTIRSCVAALLILGALAKGRDPVSLRLVAVGAILVLLFLPESLMGPSFQLSFAAVTAIIALHDSAPMRLMRARMLDGWANKTARACLILFLTGLAVEATLAPIALYHFHETGLYGAIANMVAIPLTTFAIMPLLAAALFADLIGLGAPFWWLAGQALDLLLFVAGQAAHAPGAHLLVSAIPGAAFALYALGLSLLFLLAGRARLAGLVPIIAGVAWMIAAGPPDMLIDSSGRHVVLTGAEERFYVAREGGGDFMRDLIVEQTGSETRPDTFGRIPGAECSRDACLLTAPKVGEGSAPVTMLVTLSSRWLEYDAMISACAAVDIVVSDRKLPRACKPKWLKADRALLSRTGGLALDFSPRRIDSVAADQAHLPWSRLDVDYAGLLPED